MKATVTFDQVFEAINRVLAAYEVRPGGQPLENSATLIADMSIAVLEADLLGNVPPRESWFFQLETERPFYKRPLPSVKT